MSFPPHPVPGGMLSRSIGMPSRKNGPPSMWETHGKSGNVFASPVASSTAPYPQELNPSSSGREEPIHSSTAEKNENQTPVQDQRCQSGASAKNSVIFSGGDSLKNYGADQQRLQILDKGTPKCGPYYDHFRATGSHDSVENYTDLFTNVLRNDDIQEFDSKWDCVLSSMTKIPHDDILEGLYKLRIRVSEKLKTVLELYDLETHQKKLGPDYYRLKTMVKRSIEQEIRNKNFGARSGNFEKNAVVKNPGTKQRVQRILGDCWQWEANGQCVKGDNCSFRHDINKRGKSSPSNPSVNHREPEAPEAEVSPSGRTSRWPCKDYFRGTCNNSFCEKWILQNACSTRPRVVVGLGKCAHTHIVRLMNSRLKGPKRMMTKVQWLC